MVDLSRYRIAHTVVGSVSRVLGVMLRLSGRAVLWGNANFNADTVFTKIVISFI